MFWFGSNSIKNQFLHVKQRWLRSNLLCRWRRSMIGLSCSSIWTASTVRLKNIWIRKDWAESRSVNLFFLDLHSTLIKQILILAVVQYLENAGIIAVNYAARALGVTRHMREKEAKAACPELICVRVPSKNGKADLTKYRDAGLRVAKVLQTFTPLLERASVDEGESPAILSLVYRSLY